MQGITCRICRKKPTAIRPIEHQMTGREGLDSSPGLLKLLAEGSGSRKLEMTRGTQGKRNRIGGHLLADLAAPQYDELEASEFLESHGPARVDS